MQRYNQRMVEQLKVRQQQEKARLPKIQRSEGKTRMAMYKKSLHINGAGSASEQREKIKQVGLCGCAEAGGLHLMRLGGWKTELQGGGVEEACQSPLISCSAGWFPLRCWCFDPVASSAGKPLPLASTETPLVRHPCGLGTWGRWPWAPLIPM